MTKPRLPLASKTTFLKQAPCTTLAPVQRRLFSSASQGEEEEDAEVMEYDVLIVGGGPAGKSHLLNFLVSNLIKLLL